MMGMCDGDAVSATDEDICMAWPSLPTRGAHNKHAKAGQALACIEYQELKPPTTQVRDGFVQKDRRCRHVFLKPTIAASTTEKDGGEATSSSSSSSPPIPPWPDARFWVTLAVAATVAAATSSTSLLMVILTRVGRKSRCGRRGHRGHRAPRGEGRVFAQGRGSGRGLS